MLVFEREKVQVFFQQSLHWCLERIVHGWWSSPSGIGADMEIPNESIFLKTCHTQSGKGRQPVYESGIYVTFRHWVSDIKNISFFIVLVLKAQVWKSKANTSNWFEICFTPKEANLDTIDKQHIWSQNNPVKSKSNMCRRKCLESCGSLAVVALCGRTRSCIVDHPSNSGFCPLCHHNLSQLQNGNTFPIQKCLKINQEILSKTFLDRNFWQTGCGLLPSFGDIWGAREGYLPRAIFGGIFTTSFRQMPLLHTHMKSSPQQSKLRNA